MNPQQYPPGQPYPQPSPPNAPHERYDFIMNPGQPQQRRSLGKPGGLLFLVGAFAVVVIVLVIIFNVLKGGGGDSKPFISVVQRQQEIVRVAGLNDDSVQQQNVKNFVITTELGIQSDQTTLTNFLGKHGVKVSAKQVALGANAATDKQLTDAKASSTLDATYVTVLQNQLTQYQAALSKAYQSTSGTSTRTLLKQLNQHAELLLTQSKQ